MVSSSCQLTMLQANKLTTMRVGRSELLLLGAGAGGKAADRAVLPSMRVELASRVEGGNSGKMTIDRFLVEKTHSSRLRRYMPLDKISRSLGPRLIPHERESVRESALAPGDTRGSSNVRKHCLDSCARG